MLWYKLNANEHDLPLGYLRIVAADSKGLKDNFTTDL